MLYPPPPPAAHHTFNLRVDRSAAGNDRRTRIFKGEKNIENKDDDQLQADESQKGEKGERRRTR